MATLTSELEWFDKPDAEYGVVSMLYKVKNDSSWNRRIARIYRFPDRYVVQFIGDLDDPRTAPPSFESLGDAKSYAYLTALFTSKGKS